MSELVRSEPPTEALSALVAIYVLTFILLFFGALVVLGLLFAWNVTWISLWIGAMFIATAVITDIYRRNFLPDEMVVKTRIPKITPRRELRE